MWIGEQEIKMDRGWIVQYQDGHLILENEMHWRKVPNKRDIRKVFLKWEDRIWSIENQENYTVPTRRGYVDISPSGAIGNEGVHSRTIGYYDTENKCKVIMRVVEATGQMAYETIPF